MVPARPTMAAQMTAPGSAMAPAVQGPAMGWWPMPYMGTEGARKRKSRSTSSSRSARSRKRARRDRQSDKTQESFQDAVRREVEKLTAEKDREDKLEQAKLEAEKLEKTKLERQKLKDEVKDLKNQREWIECG